MGEAGFVWCFPLIMAQFKLLSYSYSLALKAPGHLTAENRTSTMKSGPGVRGPYQGHAGVSLSGHCLSLPHFTHSFVGASAATPADILMPLDVSRTYTGAVTCRQ